jgi:hypothetical protein
MEITESKFFRWAIPSVYSVTSNNNKSNTTRVLFISQITLLKNDYMFRPLFFLGHHQVVSILFQGKLYNVYSVVLVSLNRHFVNKTYVTEYFIGI